MSPSRTSPASRSTDLKPNDFTVLEDGKPQKIQVFEFQKLAIEPEPPEPPPTLGDQNALPDDPKTTITARRPGRIQYHDKRLMVFFFDFSSMGIPEQLRAQEAALQIPRQADDHVRHGGHPAVHHRHAGEDRFHRRPRLLTDIIKGLPIGEMTEMADVADTGDDNGEDTGAAFVADETEFNIFNTDQQAGRHRRGRRASWRRCPEKKALVYFTGGISKTGVDNQAQLEASINAAVKANVAIYPDRRARPDGRPSRRRRQQGRLARQRASSTARAYNSQRAAINDSQETLATLAADTGGKAFLDSNDLAARHRSRCSRSSAATTSWATTPPTPPQDGKYRKITVKLNNSLSAKLELRHGYYAQKVWGKFNGHDKEQQLKEALSAGDPLTDLPLALEVDYFRVSPTAYFVPVSVKIPGSVVALAREEGGAARRNSISSARSRTSARAWWATCAISSRSSWMPPAKPRNWPAATSTTTPASRWARAGTA